MLPCEWFAACTNMTNTALDHPVLGPRPCCERCARTVGAEDELLPFILEDTDKDRSDAAILDEIGGSF
jgi:hypothetical protein